MAGIKRREFITLIGGAAGAWPLAASAQQRERMRRISIILPASSDDAEYQVRVGALLEELQHLGWVIGRNIQVETRWTKRDPTTLANMRPNWWRSHRTPSLRPASRRWDHCYN